MSLSEISIWIHYNLVKFQNMGTQITISQFDTELVICIRLATESTSSTGQTGHGHVLWLREQDNCGSYTRTSFPQPQHWWAFLDFWLIISLSMKWSLETIRKADGAQWTPTLPLWTQELQKNVTFKLIHQCIYQQSQTSSDLWLNRNQIELMFILRSEVRFCEQFD